MFMRLKSLLRFFNVIRLAHWLRFRLTATPSGRTFQSQLLRYRILSND